MKKTDTNLSITEINIHPISPTKKGIVAFVSFIINNMFKVTNVMIATSLKRGGEYRLVYPIQKLPNNSVIQIFYPINKEIGKKIEEAVLIDYHKFIKKIVNTQLDMHN